MDWKVQLEGADGTLAQLRDTHNTANARITRNGVEWFLESSDFELLTDPVMVKQKATLIINSILAAAPASGVTIGMGPVYRMHYDGSKTVFRDA